jgi:hypothetical protein
MAIRREHRLWMSALAAALALNGAPLLAQTAPAPATNSTTTAPAPTPAPPPAPTSNDVVGPEQLRDFNLNGTVTQRPDPAPATTQTTPSARPVTSAPAAASTNLPVTTPAARAAAPVRSTPSAAVSGDVVTPAPLSATPVDVIAPGFGDDPVAAPPLEAPDSVSGLPWPWILAALVAVLGTGFLFWRRRHSGAHRDEGLAIARASAAPLPRVPQPAAPQPRAPAPVAPRPDPAAAPRPAPSPAPTPAPAPISAGIVASRLKPSIAFELHPIRADVDSTRGVSLLFDVVVSNNGSAPARDVLVEGQLFNAGPTQDEQIGRFFLEPVGKGERLPVIPPMGRVSVKSRLAILSDELVPVEVDGRSLFVPLVAFNALYSWSGGEGQDSASFLVGRGDDDSAKMAPFRLDQGARSWTGLGARQHSDGLTRT